MAYLEVRRLLRWRLPFVVTVFVLTTCAVLARVFSLAIIEHRRFVQAAAKQHQFTEALPSLRGTISFQDKSGTLYPVATQGTFYILVASPKNVRDPTGLAHTLASILPGTDEAELAAKLGRQDDPYEVLAHKLNQATADRIRPLSGSGLDLVEEFRRVYPQGKLAAALIGFASAENGEETGAYGIERGFDQYLRGAGGFFEGEKDAAGSLVFLGRQILNPPVNGDNVVLSVDPQVQFRVEQELAALAERWSAESATAVALEPSTGRILALASLPTFDPNAYSREQNFSVFRMPAINAQFELGSVFKPITMAAGINEGVVRPETTYRDPGVVKIGGRTIQNFDNQEHGIQTMTQVLEKSLNTGAVFVSQRLGKDRFLDAIKRFGFGVKTGVDFPNEASGDISNLPAMRDIDYATASFGQGIAVTPLQMASAIGAIANHGVLMQPHLVDRIVNENGVVREFKPMAVREVVRPETAETVTRMLVSVVRNGYDNRAGVPGYFVAGKTGTAQIPGRSGYTDEFIHTFVGYAPAFNPKFLILIQLNKPTGNRFAANTLTAGFRNLAAFMLNYYDVPPDER